MVALEEKYEKKQKRGELAFPIDKMHSGIRATVMGTFVGAGILGFVGGVFLLPNAIPIAALMGMVIGSGGAYGIEQYLKENWPSGRELVVNTERIALVKHGEVETALDGTQHVNVLAWQFKVKKDSPRAKKGSYLVALALEQDDHYIVIYTIATQEQFDNMPLAESFTKLKPKKDKDKNKSKTKSVSNMRDAGEQRRLQAAEFVRSMDGGDINFEQFCEYIEFLQANYSEWITS